MEEQKGNLIVVSGFSGAGKGTLMKELIRQYDCYALSISATTRNPREGEQDGREYFFKTVKEFENMIAGNQLIEYARYVDNYYGTPKEYVEGQRQAGKDVILEIEIQGALKIKKQYPEVLLIFVLAPSAKELKSRLVGRGTESEEVIEARLNRAVQESAYIEEYDYILINDNLEESVERLHQVIQAQHNLTLNNKNLIENMRQELQGFVKGE